MTTSFRGYVLKRSGDDKPQVVGVVTSPSLYLDTSDLSYLLVGRLGRSTRPERWRSRLLKLLGDGRVRLRVSPLHFAELALHPQRRQLGLEALATTPNIHFVPTGSTEIFRAELERRPVTLVEQSVTRSEVEAVSIPLRLGLNVRGAVVARAMKMLVRFGASAERTSKEADRLTNADARKDRKRQILRILRGDTRGVPGWNRLAAVAFSRLAPWLARRVGLPSGGLERFIEQGPRGLGWAVTAVPDAELPRKDNKAWQPQDVRAMPATVLRACVEYVHANPERPAEDRTRYDVEHLAYVAYSDYSTIDGPNYDETKQVRPLLPHLHIFPTGDLDPVLDAIERIEHPQAGTRG